MLTAKSGTQSHTLFVSLILFCVALLVTPALTKTRAYRLSAVPYAASIAVYQAMLCRADLATAHTSPFRLVCVPVPARPAIFAHQLPRQPRPSHVKLASFRWQALLSARLALQAHRQTQRASARAILVHVSLCFCAFSSCKRVQLVGFRVLLAQLATRVQPASTSHNHTRAAALYFYL